MNLNSILKHNMLIMIGEFVFIGWFMSFSEHLFWEYCDPILSDRSSLNEACYCFPDSNMDFTRNE